MSTIPENPAERAKAPEKNGRYGAKLPYRLTQEIIPLSVAGSWDEAKLEWDLLDIFLTDPESPGTCLCGHFPIREHCVLRNRLNGTEVVVGNCCVKRFLPIDTGALFACCRRVMTDPTRALNTEAIEHAFSKGWINPREKRFLLDTRRKPWCWLSHRQQSWRDAINTKVIRRLSREGTHAS